MSEKETYLASIASKEKNGLKDVKFFFVSAFDPKEEDAYAELNRLHAASDLPDREVLGKYSPNA
jgi:hypothetical protein